jgi:hypothetical protein
VGPIQLPIQWVSVLPRGLKRPVHGIGKTPTSSAEVKEQVELYLYSPSGPSWPVLGRILPLSVLIYSVKVLRIFNFMTVFFSQSETECH